MDIKTTASTHTGGALWDIGATMAGFKPVWGVEYDPNKCKWAMRNIPDFTVLCSDVATVDYSLLPRVYHLHSSPSCKNASIANQGGGEATEDVESAKVICRAIEAIKPRTFTLENVWLYRDFDSFGMIVRKLRELAYAVDWWHLNAADYGVPQTRKRLILIASQDRQPAMPTPTHTNPDLIPQQAQLFGPMLRPWRGWYEAIEDLIPVLPETKLAEWQIKRLPDKLKTLLIEPTEMRGNGIQKLRGEPACTLKASRHENFKAILINNDSKVGTLNNAEHGFSIVRSRYDQPKAFIIDGKLNSSGANITTRIGNEPSFTITGSHNNKDCKGVSSHIVKMTARALARFQSLPDSYELPKNNRLACEIIGNGVPCQLAKVICESILD